MLSNVSCAGPSFCVALGSSSQGAITEQWNGTSWSFVSSPLRSGATSSAFSGVSCTSVSNCTAVGGDNLPGPLIERWDGSSWQIMSAPSGGVLQRVSRASSTDCVAVGVSDDQSGFAEHYDDVSWSITPAPPTGNGRAQRRGLCIGHELHGRRRAGFEPGNDGRGRALERLEAGPHWRRSTRRATWPASWPAWRVRQRQTASRARQVRGQQRSDPCRALERIGLVARAGARPGRAWTLRALRACPVRALRAVSQSVATAPTTARSSGSRSSHSLRSGTAAHGSFRPRKAERR